MNIVIILSLLIPLGCDGVTPHSCQKDSHPLLFLAPSTLLCGNPLAGEKVKLELRKKSAEALTVQATLFSANRITCLATSHWTGTTTREIKLSPHTLSVDRLAALERYSCPQDDGLYLPMGRDPSDPPCVYQWPYTISTTTVFCQMQGGLVYYDQTGVATSDLGALVDCNISLGRCKTVQGYWVTWSPPSLIPKFSPATKSTGYLTGDVLVVPSLQEAFVITDWKDDEATTQEGHLVTIYRLGRSKRAIEELRDEILAKFNYLSTQELQPLKVKVESLCASLKRNPTTLLESVLNTTLLHVETSGNLLSVWTCTPLKNCQLRGSDTCVSHVPITCDGQEGFLDPHTGQVFNRVPSPCGFRTEIPVELDGLYYLWNGTDAMKVVPTLLTSLTKVNVTAWKRSWLYKAEDIDHTASPHEIWNRLGALEERQDGAAAASQRDRQSLAWSFPFISFGWGPSILRVLEWIGCTGGIVCLVGKVNWRMGREKSGFV